MAFDTPTVDSSPPSHKSSSPSVAGHKRSAPSLLPAFEPFPSPALPRPAKRIAREPSPDWAIKTQKYPTPVPTSETIVPSSSPPLQGRTRNSGLARTHTTLSERAPLAAVPTIELAEDGQPILMGRSSNASHYQLSTNKLVSRVHVRATYVSAEPPASKTVRIECLGWNGMKLHCEHKVFTLHKNDTFTSETEYADIMIDVHDARVVLQWPREESRLTTPVDSDTSSVFDESSPRRRAAVNQSSPLGSPLRHRVPLQSPLSPSKAIQTVPTVPGPLGPDHIKGGPFDVYVDEDARQEEDEAEAGKVSDEATQSTQIASQPLGDSQFSAPGEPQEFSDNEEENDPIIHSFGPFGANLDSRLAAITAGDSPERPRLALSPLKASSISPQRLRILGSSQNQDANVSPVVNHVINQLAYSRLASTPLSTIMSHLPAQFKDAQSPSKENTSLTPAVLKRMLDSTACIGEVTREGKDAAGKPLESEFYYIPEADDEAKRRDAVVEGLRKPGLRACRKQHKVSNLASSRYPQSSS
ncbi:MAG: hypothetical protein L6R37_000149 [Teloschistes peruensis]|nr:MAG: hypothetical protein L6R37_000149 [Teloschistes peruensis]